MLHFRIESTVPHSFVLVSENFSEDLFIALAPAFPPSELIEFDGDRIGGFVKIRLGKGPVSKVWVSEITSRVERDGYLEFVDEGRELPPPLKKWRHTHIIQRLSEASTLIVDDIQFSSGLKGLDYLIYPLMKTMFAARTAAYRKYYKELVER